MKKDTLILVAFGFAALYLLQQNRQPAPQYYPNYPQIPQAPPRTNGAAFAQWVNSILQIYGNVRQLWEPGGPFYKEQITPEQVNQMLANTWYMV